MKSETMQCAPSAEPCTETATPSAEFVTAISEFFQTDPSDLLAELGYYHRQGEVSTSVETTVNA
jgi:hypothetical protein